jgi:hypothetical protein
MAGPYSAATATAPSGNLLGNVGTLLRLGVDLLSAGLQGGTQMMYGMGGPEWHGHPWPMHGGHHSGPHGHGAWFGHHGSCAPHVDCCSSCAPYVDCCCCYGHHGCNPGVHNCP